MGHSAEHINMMNKQVSVLAIEYAWERTLLRALLTLLAFLTIGYLYFVASSVLNVIAHKEAIAQTAQIESEIGLLEQKYFTLSQDLTPAAGSALGLAPITAQKYVYRHGNVGNAVSTQAKM